MVSKRALALEAVNMLSEYLDSRIGGKTPKEKDAINAIKDYILMADQPRTRGEWIDVPKYKGFYVCSKCLERLDGNFERFEHWNMTKENFCSVCGSDNRKEPAP